MYKKAVCDRASCGEGMRRSSASPGRRCETGLGLAGGGVGGGGRGHLTESLVGQNELNIYSVEYEKLTNCKTVFPG